MKNLILIISLLLAADISANSLWAVDDIYNLGEVLHAARYDYDGGMKVSFERAYQDAEAEKLMPACEKVSSLEILKDFQLASNNHLSAYYDDEFDFESSLESLGSELKSYNIVSRCKSASGYQNYYSDSGEFIVSYKLL